MKLPVMMTKLPVMTKLLVMTKLPANAAGDDDEAVCRMSFCVIESCRMANLRKAVAE